MNSGTIDPENLDTLFQFIVAVASEAEERSSRELGPIHLLKYAYLADLAFASENDGRTFTGVPWVFHNFGPWSVDAARRIDSALDGVGADRVSRQFAHGERERFVLREPGAVVDRLRGKLPQSVTGAVSRGVREFGNDTYDLLNHVYVTEPMLKAGPGDRLVFSGSERDGSPVPRSPVEESRPSVRQRKARTQKLREIQEGLSARLARRRESLEPMPEPRYDAVFREGAEWIEKLSDQELPADGSYKASVDAAIWGSRHHSAE